MAIDATMVKQLREKTGAGVMDCKRALEEAGGDYAKAEEVLVRKGFDIAKKKSERATAQGRIGTYLHATGKVAALVEVNCESDFVAMNDGFVQFAKDLSMQVAAMNPIALTREDVPKDLVDKEKAFWREKHAGQPADAVDKILEERLTKFYEEKCLLEQRFIKDEALTIQQLVTAMIAKTGENCRIKRFVRFAIER